MIKPLSACFGSGGIFCLIALICVSGVLGCRSPGSYHREADAVAEAIMEVQGQAAFGRDRQLTIEKPSHLLRRKLLESQDLPHSSAASFGTDMLAPVPHWPEELPAAPGADDSNAALPEDPIRLSLMDALRVGARNDRKYQDYKEQIFEVALDLDLEYEKYRGIFSGAFTADAELDPGVDDTVGGVAAGFKPEFSRTFRNGLTLSTGIALDVVKLLTSNRPSSTGLLADFSVSLPLLGENVSREIADSLTQAERNVLYKLYQFERYRREYAVNVTDQYFGVLSDYDKITNAESNYKRVIASARRAKRLAASGRQTEVEVGEAEQDELSARKNWISAIQNAKGGLDGFKRTLGLPVDARIDIDRDYLQTLMQDVTERLNLESVLTGDRDDEEIPPADVPIELEQPPEAEGPETLDFTPGESIEMALGRRLDLKIENMKVDDSQRAVVLKADDLKAGLKLEGGGSAGGSRNSLGSADDSNVELRPETGDYSVGLEFDLPWNKTAERNAYRKALIDLEKQVRSVQESEDSIKLAIRGLLRNLAESAENARIQTLAVSLARRRVDNTDLQLQAGRVQIRDVLIAQKALLSAQNALTEALMDYRLGELKLQRDMGILEITDDGLWQEYTP